MEIEESEIFEIIDYTNATDWEKFISKFEEILTQFDNCQLVDSSSINEIHKITFNKYELNINLFEPSIKFLEYSKNSFNDSHVIEIEDCLAIKENKPQEIASENGIHWELVKWFGKRRFVVLCPSKSTSIYGQDQVSQLISSITIAAVNVKSQLPIVIKYGPRNWPLYLGIQFDGEFKRKIQCAVIKYAPKSFQTLSGIRRVFQEKLGKGCVFDDDVIMTAKYIYQIDNCSNNNHNYFQGLIRPMKKKMHFFQYMSIGFGKDPIKNFKVVAHWSRVPKQVLIQSDLDSLPLSTANNWYLVCESENSYDGIMYKTLRKLLKSFLVAQRSSEILQESRPQDIDTTHINQPLLKLTNFPISNHHLFEKSFGNRVKSENPTGASGSNRNELFDGKILQEILLFLFPDAKSDYKDSIRPSYKINQDLNLPNYKKLQKKFPNSNSSSLIHRLAVCLTNLLNNHKEGIKCFSFVWMEVVLELRYRLENGIPLPDTRMKEDFTLLDKEIDNKDEIFARLLTDSMPYLGSSQLEQRFQLIDYCILTRLRSQSMKTDENPSDNSDSDETTEQFYDCETDNDNCLTNSLSSKSGQEPRGRLRKHGDLKLLNHPDTALYVPLTQVLSVDVYSKWKQAKHDQLISYMENYHAVSLIADMSAFKAANPGCVLEDFIRWYSPKDFIEMENTKDETGEPSFNIKGELSSRMSAANNTWLTSWHAAVPMPARLQKRLFDDTNAAETALKWMENLTSAEISSCLINNSLLDSLNAIVECLDEQDPPEILQQVDNASAALIKFFDEIDVMDVTGAELEYYQVYDELISHFQRMEYSLTVKKSLHHKFLSNFTGSYDDKKQIIAIINHLLVTENEVNISKYSLSKTSYAFIFNRLMSMYSILTSTETNEEMLDIDNIFVQTFQKEYLLSLNCPYPFPTSRKSNQQLYVCLNDGEFLISSNFCDDITYF